MERGASPLSSVSYNLRLSIQGCLLEVFIYEHKSMGRIKDKRRKRIYRG